MPSWDPTQYLKFSRQRTQPSRDLAARISVEDPARALDLGCGPGNSTAVLAEHFPEAKISGADISQEMLARARTDYPEHEFFYLDVSGDLSAYQGLYDIVFSNACLHWVPDHKRVVPAIMGMVAPGGQLAVQIPLMNMHVMHQKVVSPLLETPRWHGRFERPQRTFELEPRAYLPILASCSTDYSFWITSYWHRMASKDAVVDWYRGSTLRHYLGQLEQAEQDAFLADVRELVEDAYEVEETGEVILEMPRLFWVATKGE